MVWKQHFWWLTLKEQIKNCRNYREINKLVCLQIVINLPGVRWIRVFHWFEMKVIFRKNFRSHLPSILVKHWQHFACVIKYGLIKILLKSILLTLKSRQQQICKRSFCTNNQKWLSNTWNYSKKNIFLQKTIVRFIAI